MRRETTPPPMSQLGQTRRRKHTRARDRIELDFGAAATLAQCPFAPDSSHEFARRHVSFGPCPDLVFNLRSGSGELAISNLVGLAVMN